MLVTALTETSPLPSDTKALEVVKSAILLKAIAALDFMSAFTRFVMITRLVTKKFLNHHWIMVELSTRIIDPTNTAAVPGQPGVPTSNTTYNSGSNYAANPRTTEVDVLIVGGGGSSGAHYGGGGGGSGVIYRPGMPVSGGTTYPISVGSGAFQVLQVILTLVVQVEIVLF